MHTDRQSLINITNYIIDQHPEINQFVLERHKQVLSNKIVQMYNNTVAYGPFKGLKFCSDSHWGAADKGSIILGLYEQEVLNEFLTIPNHMTTFIDLGAADGYYGVGALVSGKFKKSYCYEITQAGRHVIARNSVLNNVSNNLIIRGEATKNLPNEIPFTDLKNSVLFVDIEGAEFDLFDSDFYLSFKDSVIFIELHDFFFSDGKQKLELLIKGSNKTHIPKLLKMSNRDLSVFPELNQWNDFDRWILCSEGRAQLMTWVRFDPITNNVEDAFTTIYEKNLWGDSESRSGSGSTLEYTENLRVNLPLLFEKFGVRSIFDAPCGDFNWMRHVINGKDLQYIGGDVVKELVCSLNMNYTSKNVKFINIDITTSKFPNVDLMICRDCLFHLSYHDINLVLNNFIESGIPYILTTTHVNRRSSQFVNSDIVTGGFRLLDLFSPPFNFPTDCLYTIDDWISPFPERIMCLWTRDQILCAISTTDYRSLSI